MGALQKVIIVGAGPAGLLLALFLSKEKIPVHVLEATSEIDAQPRATHYGPAGVQELERAGVLEAIRAEGFLPKDLCWRKEDGNIIAELQQEHIPLHSRVTSLPVNRVAHIMLDALRQHPTAKVDFNCKVTRAGQDDDKAWAEVQTPDGVKTLEASYIVGSDGASSTIRKNLFGDSFPGRTWEPWLIASNVYYDFDAHGWDDINFVIHPQNWFMAARITKYGLWRVTYGEDGELTREQCIERQQERYRSMLPGNPGPEQYKVANISPYRVHQRCAEKFRVGRFLLVADAAHLCNPFGGFGLTSGIVDVGGLYDCLSGIYNGLADESILDKYDEVRRRIFIEQVDKLSTANLQRVMMAEPDRALELDPFLNAAANAKKDPEAAARLAQMARGANALKHDFRQYYKTLKTESSASENLCGT
ncbi:hypothetical protein BKA65DRAFT_548486 [Rhexocercosporidium sp. MPI-PUGE-AT-0058]|nr:hypothetical protein BKA65DRAFT_548486 [Rhexocercosporidium sp. MPI-PUGE-AT-0058]